MLILLPIAATTFNFYGKVKTYLGFDSGFEESEDEEALFGSGGWREGRNLIEQELGGGSFGVLGAPAGSSGISRARSPVIGVMGAGERRGLTTVEADEEDEEEGEEGALLGVWRRVRNTVDVNLPRPNWSIGGGERRGGGQGQREGQRGGILSLFGGTGGVRI